jgi:HSP20 family molecular chaperone IbpA
MKKEKLEVYRISYFLNSKDRMMYMEETESEYLYYIGLPGISKKDIDIRLIVEKNFITIFVNIKKDTTFVDAGDYKIVKYLKEISEKSDIQVLLDKGVLEITILK